MTVLAGSADAPRRQFIFGYGSLAAAAPLLARVASLQGFVRVWNVAMHNRTTLPGYKYYVDPATGERPPVFVTFLSLLRQHGSSVAGVLRPVDSEELARLDERERNYVRLDVTERITPAVSGTVHAYVASDAGRMRFARGVAAGTAVVDSNYVKSVENAYGALGPEALEQFRASTEPVPCPQRRLQRIDVPPHPLWSAG